MLENKSGSEMCKKKLLQPQLKIFKILSAIWTALTKPPSPILSALVSDETRWIWVSTQVLKPVVSSVYYGFYYYNKFQLMVETQPMIETKLETG